MIRNGKDTREIQNNGRFRERNLCLDPDRIADRGVFVSYLRELFPDSSSCLLSPESADGNLDALSDDLSELRTDTVIYISRASMQKISSAPYAWTVFRVFAVSAAENPHLRLVFTN